MVGMTEVRRNEREADLEKEGEVGRERIRTRRREESFNCLLIPSMTAISVSHTHSEAN